MDVFKRFMFLLLSVMILNVLQLCSGLRCYQCSWMNGMGEKECLQEPPPSRFLTECIQPQCWKKYSHQNGNTNVQRYCVAVATDRASCQRSSFPDPYGEPIPATECTCNSDGCNGSTTFHRSSANYNSVMLFSVGIMAFSRAALINLLQ